MGFGDRYIYVRTPAPVCILCEVFVHVRCVVVEANVGNANLVGINFDGFQNLYNLYQLVKNHFSLYMHVQILEQGGEGVGLFEDE